jgi:hypothetical protein
MKLSNLIKAIVEALTAKSSLKVRVVYTSKGVEVRNFFSKQLICFVKKGSEKFYVTVAQYSTFNQYSRLCGVADVNVDVYSK